MPAGSVPSPIVRVDLPPRAVRLSRFKKALDKILSGRADANVAFGDARLVLRHLGFEERTRGDHHIFTKPGLMEVLNLQPKLGKAKPYQVRQVREVILRYGLREVARGD